MTRLYRPYIPLDVRCDVVLRQTGLGEPSRDLMIAHSTNLKKDLEGYLQRLARVELSCERKDLRLDHDPPLGARRRKGKGKNTVYDPPANSPDHLIYREQHAHLIKTNVRGEHGQHPDRVLIKKERRRLRKGKRRKGPKIAPRINPWPKNRKIKSRGFQRRIK